MVKSTLLKPKRSRKEFYGLPVIVLLVLGLLLTACGEQATPVSLTLATTAPSTTAAGATAAAATSAATTAATSTTAAVATTAAASAATATIAPAVTPSATTAAATTSAAGGTTPAATTAVSGTASTVPTVQVPDAARQVIANISKQTEKTRGLTFKTPVETNFMTRADLTKYQTDEFNKQVPPEIIKRDEKILKVSGLPPKPLTMAKPTLTC